MFKMTLLMSSLRQYFCLLAAGILLVGQLSPSPGSFVAATAAEFNSLVSIAPSGPLIGTVSVDDSSDFLPVATAEIAPAGGGELPLQDCPAPLLLATSGFLSSPLARPPPLL